MAQNEDSTMTDKMLPERMDDVVNDDVADSFPQLCSTDSTLMEISQGGRCSRLMPNNTDYGNDCGTHDATGGGDMSSDLRFSQGDDSGVEGLSPKSDALEKRKASPDCNEEARTQKKARTETGGQETPDSTTTDIKTNLRQSLAPTQKTYLTKNLTTLSRRKYAVPSVSLERPTPADGSEGPGPIDLSTILAKLREDEYTSVQAFQDDVQIMVRDKATESGSKSTNSCAGQRMLDFVNKFLVGLPNAKGWYEEQAKAVLRAKQVAIIAAEHKGEEGKSTKAKTVVTEPRVLKPGPSEEQKTEMKYALKQAAAFRAGTQSNTGKITRDKVLEAVEELVEEIREIRTKAAEKNSALVLSHRDGDGSSEDKMEDEADQDGENPGDDVSNSFVVETGGSEDEKDEHGEQGTLTNGECNSDSGPKDKRLVPAVAKLDRLESYEKNLSKLSKDRPSLAQITTIERLAATGPNFLGRTASLERGLSHGAYHKKTNGFTSHDVLLPAADSRKSQHCSHRRLSDMSQGLIKLMVGFHLVWQDLISDELLSYSKSSLFLVVHGLCRHHEGQGDVTIQYMDRREAGDRDGNPAKFYSALDLYTEFGVPQWPGWGHMNNIRLHPRKFTQEYLTHGPVLNSNSTFKQAHMVDLIKDGLYEIFPEFEAPVDHKRAGLYSLQVVYRKVGYPPSIPTGGKAGNQQTNHEDEDTLLTSSSEVNPSSSPCTSPAPDEPVDSRNNEVSDSSTSKPKPKKTKAPIYSYNNCARQVPMTAELLATVRKVTLNFRRVPEGADEPTFEPPLHAFISFLTFEKRQNKDPVFMAHIKKHYTAQDALDLYADSKGQSLPGMTVVADNLPEYMQYLDLIRDCIDFFDLEPLPPNVVEKEHVFGGLWGRPYTYAAEDHVQHRKDVKSKKFVPKKTHMLLEPASSEEESGQQVQVEPDRSEPDPTVADAPQNT